LRVQSCLELIHKQKLHFRPDDAVTWMVVMDAWWMDGRWWACGD
jgi:hypothetical protein